MNSGEKFVNYYELLGVAIDANPIDIKKAYFTLAKDAHPDAGGSTEQMQLLNTAYRTLSDPIKHAAYNKVYNLHTNVQTSTLDLKEDDYNISSENKIDDGLEDLFVDQLYSEYYDTDKKSSWKSRFKRK